ncbi:MAG: hypothetical protein K2Y39_18835 [Candidatus Obscuribacterales bacterium]|nr:hypothetical protein [Candidatus Obscuribacterales bacterium]
MEKPDGQRETLWYRLPETGRHSVDDSADCFAVANIFGAMESGVDCVVHGRVSGVLLRNLSEFQAVWSSWFPELYKSVEIIADAEDGQTAMGAGESRGLGLDAAIAAYTGGIDSSYTVMRHSRKLCGRMTQPLKACLFVHGFDIPLADVEPFERVVKRLEKTLSGTGLELISMASNHKELYPRWDHTHIAGVASCLMLLSKSFDRALIGSTYTYNEVSMKWGSNPITDRLLSSHRIAILHDGAETGRGAKMAALRGWPEAYDDLRICWSAPNKDENCGTCGKCALTLLGFRFKKLPLPKSFPSGLSEARIESLEFDESHLNAAETLLRFALREPQQEPWVAALKKCVETNRKRLNSDGSGKGSFYGRVKRRLSRLSK